MGLHVTESLLPPWPFGVKSLRDERSRRLPSGVAGSGLRGEIPTHPLRSVSAGTTFAKAHPGRSGLLLGLEQTGRIGAQAPDVGHMQPGYLGTFPTSRRLHVLRPGARLAVTNAHLRLIIISNSRRPRSACTPSRLRISVAGLRLSPPTWSPPLSSSSTPG